MNFATLAITVTLFTIGIIFIVKGGDYFVDAASWIAEVSGIPKLIIGATVVSLATTLPEMLVSVMAALDGKVDMSIGNAVGSVTANVGLIMGISLVFIPSVIRRKDYLLKSILMLTAASITVLCGLSGSISLQFCILLLIIFTIFIVENVKGAIQGSKNNHDEPKDPNLKTPNAIRTNIFKFIIGTIGIVVGAQLLVNSGSDLARLKTPNAIRTNIFKFIIGTIGIVVGAQLLVNSGSDLARLLGISERIIGVTLVAVGTSLPELITTLTAIRKKQASLSVGNIIGANIVGTSLPELITTLTAIRKKQASLSVGNIIGANILDLTLIMPIASIITGKALPVASNSAMVDLPACLLVSCVALIPTLITQKFAKWQGYLLLILYGIYVYITCFAL